eukprot:3785242-Pleurochrysis_carterae.AAC.1
MQVHARQLPSSQLTMPQYSRRLNSTNSSPSCLPTVCAPRKPRATAGTFCASDWPPDCSAQAVHPTSLKPCAGGSRPNPSPSIAGSKRPSMSAGSQPHTPHTLTPLQFSMLLWGPMRTSTNCFRGVGACLRCNASGVGAGANGKGGFLVSVAQCRRNMVPLPSRHQARSPRVFAFLRLRDVARAN